jgi:hypothetical protein
MLQALPNSSQIMTTALPRSVSSSRRVQPVSAASSSRPLLTSSDHGQQSSLPSQPYRKKQQTPFYPAFSSTALALNDDTEENIIEAIDTDMFRSGAASDGHILSPTNFSHSPGTFHPAGSFSISDSPFSSPRGFPSSFAGGPFGNPSPSTDFVLPAVQSPASSFVDVQTNPVEDLSSWSGLTG